MAQAAIDGDGQRLLRDPTAAERGDVCKIVCLRLLRQLAPDTPLPPEWIEKYARG